LIVDSVRVCSWLIEPKWHRLVYRGSYMIST
jgi:hypothetical protein